MNKTHTDITVFYGDQLAHSHERRAINAVREQLWRRRIPARLLVNFTVSNGGRQVDLVIVTDQRCMNVELKSLTSTLPLIGTPNGFWSQRMPDGTERKMDRNFYNQVRDQTYGISDAMAELAKKGRVPNPRHDRFFKHIDIVVCVDPTVPPGSTLRKFNKVSVVGLDTLIDRLVRPGPGLPEWNSHHWDEFIRYLGLYAEGDDAPEELRRRADAAAVEDYRRRFRELTAAGLPPLIPASALIAGQPGTIDANAMANQLTPQQRVLLLGASGNGKTHLARHTSLALTDSGQMVLWLPADDYEKNQLDRSLARAIGPFSTEKAEALLTKADEGGNGITVIVDALEKCRHREELLRQIHTLQRQYPAAVLVTTAHNGDIEQLRATDRLELIAPTGEERAALATTYGTSEGVADSAEYRTRYDISLAAQVITELPAGATTTDVLDAYVRRRTQTETVRAGLRVLAHTMDAGVRTALPVSEAMLALRRPFAATPSAIDDTLASHLVSIRQGRLRFDHERLGRFLAAEHLVLTAGDGTALAQLLTEPTHRDLQDYALELERDPARRYAAIRHLGNAELIADAVLGKYGAQTAGQALADITELLIQAASTAHQATFSVEDPETATHFDGTWNTGRQWTPTERALLSAAGHCVHEGLFLDEVGALMDRTDTAMRAAMTHLHKAGNKIAISTVVGSTFGSVGRDATMAASLVIVGSEYARTFSRDSTHAALATPMWRPNPRCFGRLYMAALLSQTVRHPDDADNLPELVETGLSLGGYHLRLQLLQAAQFASSILEADVRQRMVDVLESYEPAPHDWGSSSLRIEALASYDQITPVTTLESIHESIADVIGDENNPDHHRLAQGIVSSMFEDERVLGPYSEAIGTLPEHQRLTLFAMSVLAPEHSFASSSVMRELADAASSSGGIVGRALASGAGTVPDDTVLPQEVVAAHLYALRGWAKVASTMPPAEASADPLAVAWRLVDELLLALFRGDDMADRAEAIWQQLITELPAYSTAVLHNLYGARMVYSGEQEHFAPYHALLGAYPKQVRLLLEWALPRRDQLDLPRRHAVWNLGGYLVRALGEVGTAETADLLRTHYVHDSELGHNAVAAVRAIDSRTQM
ncbi:NERD domain-containing protein [Rhodococcus opacus]|uniref:NERD domain-containing protein n=1 Tax=Rhodococcus opacus TaxID=37919 RepID=UPI001C20B581|nr:NERD domain-containing protein [Rhodococcus opacus]